MTRRELLCGLFGGLVFWRKRGVCPKSTRATPIDKGLLLGEITGRGYRYATAGSTHGQCVRGLRLAAEETQRLAYRILTSE